jgi:hypothetical protein
VTESRKGCFFLIASVFCCSQSGVGVMWQGVAAQIAACGADYVAKSLFEEMQIKSIIILAE